MEIAVVFLTLYLLLRHQLHCLQHGDFRRARKRSPRLYALPSISGIAAGFLPLSIARVPDAPMPLGLSFITGRDWSLLAGSKFLTAPAIRMSIPSRPTRNGSAGSEESGAGPGLTALKEDEVCPYGWLDWSLCGRSISCNSRCYEMRLKIAESGRLI